MATYLIGDVHGHHDALMRLLRRIDFREDRDQLWFTGDLANRGPKGLKVLRWLYAHRDNVVAVLGNHDAHLLGCARGLRKPDRLDTLDRILAAPDRETLLRWVAERPLLHTDGKRWLVHAGLLPEWSRKEAKAMAAELSEVLQQTMAVHLLAKTPRKQMPRRWRDAQTTIERQQLAFFAFVSMRWLTVEGEVSFEKGPPCRATDELTPWFERFDRGKKTVHFGHWAALGLYFADGIRAMDSGAAWGGHLTALNLDTQALFQVSTRTW